MEYKVCNKLLDPETNEHCEFDGDVDVVDMAWRCPGCRYMRWA
jgi:predicted Zn-ribbon and HTH transcriptional regulator